MTEKTFTQQEVNYILELSNIQGGLISEAMSKSQDLHEYGELVVAVKESLALKEAWDNDEDMEYSYMSELYGDTDLIKKAIEEVTGVDENLEKLKEFLEENKISVSDEVEKEILNKINEDLYWVWKDVSELRIFENLEDYMYWKNDSRESKADFMTSVIKKLQDGVSSEDILEDLTSDRTISISNGMYLFCY